jgi:acetylornithine/N-succinyldiaminopimelate aminotransferase
VVVAKALGGGLPLGAIMGTEKVGESFTPGVHGTTFGGNPVACSAGLATLNEILRSGVMENAARMGDYLKSQLENIAVEFPESVLEVRGRGLMIGLELKFDGTPVIEKLMEQHILLNLTNTSVIRWLPPLNIEKQHVDEAISALREVLKETSLIPRIAEAKKVLEKR